MLEVRIWKVSFSVMFSDVCVTGSIVSEGGRRIIRMIVLSEWGSIAKGFRIRGECTVFVFIWAKGCLMVFRRTEMAQFSCMGCPFQTSGTYFRNTFLS